MAKVPAELDHEKLQNWLVTRPRADSVAIAYRTALRVFPLCGTWVNIDRARKRDLTTLPVSRCLLTSGVACKNPTPEVFAAAFSASADAADSVADSAISAAAASADSAADSATASAFSAVSAANFSAASAFSAAADSASVWKQITNDLKYRERGDDPLQTPLWSEGPPNWFTAANAKNREIWAADPHPDNWTFWIKWWDAAIAGKPLNWELQRDVALIPDKVWKAGPGAVAKAIVEIEIKYRNQNYVEVGYFADDYVNLDQTRFEPSRGANDFSPETLVSTAIANLSPGNALEIKRVQLVVREQQAELPATFEALEGFISLEVTRLQSINYVTDNHRDDCHRQIRVLLTINSVVDRLRGVVSIKITGPHEAEKIEKLGRVYINLFQDWPRSNASDLVDSTCRAAMVGVSTVMLTMIGVPATAAVTVGAVIFGGKKLIDGAKAAKDAIGMSKPIAELPAPPPIA